MGSQDQPPIIIIRKKVNHGGHHGGAWKVAYADFVTAMMALFIVLWLLNTSEQVRKAISAYFQDPSGAAEKTGSANAGTGETLSLAKDDMPLLKEKLEQAMKKSPEFEKLKDHIEMSVTGEGLRIELLENEHGIFFDSGSPHPTPIGADLMRRLAQELGKLPNQLLVEGHTDSRPYAERGDYSNWELSSDRANSARRLMESSGLHGSQVKQVRGFADRQPRIKDHPEDASNRRISMIVCYMHPPPSAETASSNVGQQAKSGEPHKPAE